MRLRANKLKACRWNVRRTLTLFSVETAWDNHELHTRTASWQNHGAVGVSIGTSWDTRGKVATRSNLSNWLRRISVVRYAWMTYRIRKIRAFNRWSVWEVHIPGSSLSRTLLFVTHGKVVNSALTTWDGRGIASLTAVASWGADANPCVVTAGWRTLRPAGEVVLASWASLAPATVSASATWNTEQPHAKLKTGWAVAAPVGVRATATFNTRTAANKTVDSEWNIYFRLWAMRWAKYKAFTSLIFVYTPRTPVYPNEVRGGFLSPATASQLSRKQKHQLGIK